MKTKYKELMVLMNEYNVALFLICQRITLTALMKNDKQVSTYQRNKFHKGYVKFCRRPN
jgi:hypothetical protein